MPINKCKFQTGDIISIDGKIAYVGMSYAQGKKRHLTFGELVDGVFRSTGSGTIKSVDDINARGKLKKAYKL